LSVKYEVRGGLPRRYRLLIRVPLLIFLVEAWF